MTAQTIPALEAAEAEVRAAKVRRSAARAASAEAHNAQLMAAQQAERQEWADPVLVAQVAEARRVLTLAESERDATVSRLRPKHSAQFRRDAQTAAANRMPYGSLPIQGIDDLGTLVADDPAYLEAERVVKLARSDLRRLQRDAERSALTRRYEAGVRARADRLADATPRGKLDRLAGHPTAAEMTEREQSLLRLARKGGAS